ncbi:exodeoxyribonuclease I [Kaarinaea lacus]
MAQNNNKQPSLYWYDYETFGANPRRDRPAQFAGIRTDLELNIIGDPLCLYCKPANDFLPHPEACLITGITPQKALTEGLPEVEFIRQIHAEFSQPATCMVGYNNIRFDDEVTRFTLYRNFFDPYAHEWQNGNSRWDIINMVRLTHALRPEGIHWPRHPDGKPSFRLDQLTVENGISHESAHDALSDVNATIAMARLIREHQPKLYDYVFAHRSKQAISGMLNIHKPVPVLHVSAMYPAESGCIALVTPLAQHPVNKNEIFVYDLRVDPEQFMSMDVDEIKERLFTPKEELQEGKERLPVKSVHINKSPVVVPVNTLTPEAAEKWNINIEKAMQYSDVIHSSRQFIKNLQAIFAERQFEAIDDPDDMLYSGGFFSNDDRERMNTIKDASPEELAGMDLPFEDERLPEMLFRFRARNYPDTLNDKELRRWNTFRSERIVNGTDFNMDDFLRKIEDLRGDTEEESELKILDQLEQYGRSLI